MEKRKRITQYRERLDKTLASTDLTAQESIKSLVSNQLRRLDSKHGTEGCNENVVARRTAEVSNFLDMLRSASSNGSSRASETVHSEWKTKHDDEEFRVMYREGPKGAPYHTLLVEGFVDGPVDVCLCTSWESELYKRWWPQFNLPSFKILTSKCLEKVRISEQIALVRVKVSWPLSTREIIVHYFLFEYFQDDLVVVLLNSISDLDSIDITTHGFTRHAIPDPEDVIRIDVVGGFAIQKVSDTRSYFRTIANMDMKLDFVPPSLINFVSRQLIGSGFRLYQKVVASMFKSDEDFKNALKDPLYTRINEALYGRNQQDKVLEENELSFQIDQTGMHHFQEVHLENSTEESQENSMEDEKDHVIYDANEPTKTAMEINEIEEEEYIEIRHDEDEDRDKDAILGRSIAEKCNLEDQRITKISPEVEKALKTLDDAIYMMRKRRSNTETKAASCLSDEKPPDIEKDTGKNSSTSEDSNVHPKVELSASLSKNKTTERASNEPARTSSNHSSRRLGSSSSLSKDVNHNKIVPASPEQKILPLAPAEVNHTVSSFIKHGPTRNPNSNQSSDYHVKQPTGERNGVDKISENTVERYVRNRKTRYWCFPGSPVGLKKGRS
ncbi:uncharacterized protein LOC111791682 [Cucurbita pepo subsp. pepo]|uniref:uncharacterized protein LOC111791682 n=1 Tax=Cucurbita pepo subsp. pepo TaxID=3664 RepID=UPI000C9DA05D|nr:uncharacterized protein LOC111791682 [Cucurbita pepo subsp. pepo]XP_023528897.1 uncharacterized protein LOC111791682 [Cucurbita pepo subsp. pepo]XP_023528898.1 uncharacterized protein LOC111791682 [Cucurbita pepo subsp. pepo]